MRKSWKQVLIAAFLFLAAMSLQTADTVYAAPLSGEKELEENKIYYYDLDGDGKKDKLKYIVEEKKEDDYYQKVSLYINGAKKYSKVFTSLWAEYSIADLDRKDKKIDLILYCSSDSGTLDYAIFQNYENKKIKTIKTIIGYGDKNKYGLAELSRIGGLGQIKGDGSFSIVGDTSVWIPQIGCYYMYIPFYKQGNKITHKKTNTFTLTSGSQNFIYTVNQDTKVYEKADETSKLMAVLKKGDTLKIKKIKVPDSYSEDNREGYAYIEYQNGKKGWLWIPEDNSYRNDMFELIPGWG